MVNIEQRKIKYKIWALMTKLRYYKAKVKETKLMIEGLGKLL